MRIGVDIDEVLAEFAPALMEYHNATYGTSLSKRDITTYNLWEVWGGTREQAVQKVRDFQASEQFRSIQPVQGSQQATQQLRNNHELFVITSRLEDFIPETKQWIAAHFPSTFSEMRVANYFSQQNPQRSKKDICDQLGVDLLIDDCFQYAAECVSPARQVLLMDAPWNQQSSLPQGILRVHLWEDILARCHIICST